MKNSWKRTAPFTHSVVERVPKPSCPHANSLAAKEAGRQRSAGFAPVDTRGGSCPLFLSWTPLTRSNLPRDAVQVGQSIPCHRCGKQPQAIDRLCLECNHSHADAESWLRELNVRDPKFVSGKSQRHSLLRGKMSEWTSYSGRLHGTRVDGQ